MVRVRAVLRRWAEEALTSPTIADPEVRARTERTLFSRAAHLNTATAFLSPPSATLWVVLLWGNADRGRLLVWFTLVVLSAVMSALSLARFDYENGSVDRAVTRMSAALLTAGVAWGSITWLWVPADPTWKPLTGMLVLAPMVVNSIFVAAIPRFFWSFQVTLVTVALAGLILDPYPSTRVTLVILLYGLPFTGLLARIKRSSDKQAAYYAVTVEHMAAALQTANADLAHEASYDSLTDIANRHTFTRAIDAALSADERVGVVLVDLDYFKSINDTLGHAAGDAVLRGVARRLEGQNRRGDLLARLGGDEFTVLVKEPHDLAALRSVAERIQRSFEDPLVIDGRVHTLTVSAGAAISRKGDQGSDVLQAADAALYEAKRRGRGTYRLYDHDLRCRIATQVSAKRQLQSALADEEIVGWFQPIVDLQTGRVVGAEGLARWVLPDGTVRSAGDFLNPREDNCILTDVSAAVGRDLLALRHRLIREGDTCPLGLNVAAGSLNDLLERVLVEDDLSGLSLEFSETEIVADPAEAHDRLLECRARGAQIWLDDFGTGQWSMSLLTELPLDGVKIDGSFVEAMAAHREARAIVVAIIEMATTLGLSVVAEGIENQGQARMLRSLGAGSGQGYLFAPAIPADQLFDLLRSDGNWTALLTDAQPSGSGPR